jgi:hypothetical protein
MKKTAITLFATILFIGSSLSSNAESNKNLSLNHDLSLDAASCFEQGTYYAIFWRAVTESSYIESLQVALDYTARCEAENATIYHQI